MFAFREAARARDATKAIDEHASGERVLSERSSLGRRGAAERALRHDLSDDLASLMDTVDLASAIDLTGKTYVAASVINYGLTDFTSLTLDSVVLGDIERQLHASLLRHEPRLRAETLGVERQDPGEEVLNGRLRFLIIAEMRANPVDVPVEFVAEIDVGSGKIRVPNLDTGS